ncbi:unnamed protein product [marine sediment metagenome]|uniref:DUF3786 domain-containing protein n=1 Tax=marine sediment metagenome TaxID=412755 RepID=X1E064_9ZZZZ
MGAHSSFHNMQEQAYELAYKLACEQLASMDIEEICGKTGAQRMDSNKIIIEYLNQPYLITLPDIEISLRDSEEEAPLKDRILILHYLTLAKDTPATNRLITFKQLPGGASYFPAFSQRAIKPLLNHFGKEPELLIDAAAKLGGYKANYGDVAITINAFPRIPITFALWRGDDEFPPRGGIMFDASISAYLSTEDITVLCETIIWRLVKSLRGL